MALAGCSSGDGERATPTTAPTSTTLSAATGRATIELIDPGIEPRAPLRLAYTAGDRTTVAFTTDLRIDQEVDGRRQAFDSPPITQLVAYEVLSASSTGADVAFAIDQVRVDAEDTALAPEQALALQAELLELEGLGGRMTLDPTGRTTDLTLEDRPPLDLALAGRLDDLTLQIGAAAPALPEEAIGLGARWRVVQETERAGAATERTTTYELTGLTEDGFTYAATTEIRTGERQLDGATAAPATLAGTLTGTTSLTRPAFTLDATVGGEQRVTSTDAGATAALVQRIELAYAAVALPPAD